MRQPRESDSELENWNSNEVQSSETQTRIKHLIADAEQEFNELNLEIAHIQSVLNGLVSRRIADAARIHILRRAISPIKNIPAEILSKIFLYCKATHHSYDVILPPSYEHRRDFWCLSHVCSHWRRVLWDTPGAWNRIRCEPSRWQAHEPILRHILSNTKGLIDLSLAHPSDIRTSNIICQFPERFRRLALGECQLFQVCHFGGPIDYPFVSLEALNIRTCNENCVRWNQEAAPKLATPMLKSILYSRHLQHLPPLLPWAQLVKLDLWPNLSPTTLHSILSKCNSIVTCEVRVIHETMKPANFHENIVLHKLESLSLRLGKDCDANHFLRPFILTVLERLRINIQYYSWPEAEGPVVELVQRSHCQLKELEIMKPCVFEFTTLNMTPLLRITPSLIKLYTRFAVISSSTFKHILSDGLVPHIKYLDCFVLPEGAHAFLDLMEYYDSGGPLNGIQSAWISCLKGPGHDGVCDRFSSLASKYTAGGRCIRIHGLEKSEV